MGLPEEKKARKGALSDLHWSALLARSALVAAILMLMGLTGWLDFLEIGSSWWHIPEIIAWGIIATCALAVTMLSLIILSIKHRKR